MFWGKFARCILYLRQHKYGEINNWDVSNVTDMALLFKDESSFNQPLNKWDVSNVTDMRIMFVRAESFNQSLNNFYTIRDR